MTVEKSGAVTVDSGADNDTVTVTSSDRGTVAVDTGDGDDTVTVDAQMDTGDITVSTGDGDDSVTVKNTGGSSEEKVLHEVKVDLGDDTNRVTVDLSLAGTVKQVSV